MDHSARLPDIGDLRSRIRFSPLDGRIWLDNSRMILMHAVAFASFRNELIETLGISRARRMLTRIGYAAGSRDAEMARSVRRDAGPVDAFLSGPQLHALEGIVLAEPRELRINFERGEFYGDFLWIGSVEGEAHLEQFGVQPYPVCWMQLGYACGYTTTFIGKPILFREVECCASGSEHCRIVGKPVDEWEDLKEELQYVDFGKIRLTKKQCSKSGKRRHSLDAARPSPCERIEYRGPLSGGETETMVGASAGFVNSIVKLRKVAPTDAAVLLVGESGVGKECFARLLHYLSPRRDGPFIAMNCAAVPADLFEAELFGVKRGAYTGAVESRPGRFERANGGTLFLDEISSLPAACQAKLLRTLEEGQIERLGDTERRRIMVRIVAASNLDLRGEVAAGRFRADLFYRLNVFPIMIPPLRRRRDDIPILLDHFLRLYSARHGRRITGLTESAMDLILAYDYPGNVRELQKMIERAVILADDGAPIDRHHLLDGHTELKDLAMKIAKGGTLSSGDTVATTERAASASTGSPDLDSLVHTVVGGGTDINTIESLILETAVRQAGGNLARAARLVGLTRAQLAYRLEKPAVNGGQPVRRRAAGRGVGSAQSSVTAE
jgi:two-component system response regulator HydG